VYWAKEDDPVLFSQLFGKKMNWNLSEAEFARQLKTRYFNGNIMFTGEGRDLEGYIFNGVYWKAVSLHSAELHKNHFDQLYDWYSEKLVSEEAEMPENIYKALENQIAGLNTCQMRHSIIRIFKADNYEKHVKWNKNTELFVFEDCVYDLQHDKFVKANAQDYMNMSCGKIYNIGQRPVFGEKDTEVEKQEKSRKALIVKAAIDTAKENIKLFFQGIVNECDYDFFVKLLASFLRQGNKEEKGYFWLGRGRNGKGTTSEMLQNGLGNYWGELSMDYYTIHSKDIDRPNQNLYNCRNARVLNSSEVNNEDAFNRPTSFISSKFKGLTGQDVQTPREVGTKVTASFKAGTVLIQLNGMPNFSKMELSLTERIVVTEFPYSFTDNQELLLSDPIKYKMKDMSLKSKFAKEEYRIALIDILFESYQEYKKDFTIPESVKKYTNSYFSTQSIKALIDEYYEYDEKSKISLEDIKSKYKINEGKHLSIKNISIELTEAGYEVKKNQGYAYLKHYKLQVGELDNVQESNNELY
jgi:hypothetical protein